MSTYTTYIDYVSNALATHSLGSFKCHPHYTGMLEHVSQSHGVKYLELLKPIFTIKYIEAFCKINDALGDPRQCMVEGILCSPTSLRYLYHAWLILQHAKETGMTDFVEVGCGYGGLCLAISYLSKDLNIPVRSYACIDLAPASKLQEWYLSHFASGMSYHVSFHESSTYGETIPVKPVFLISCYCFSEIEAEHQKEYIRVLFPHVEHGFFAWNHIPLYDFGKPVLRTEVERPLTGQSYGVQNSFVYF